MGTKIIVFVSELSEIQFSFRIRFVFVSAHAPTVEVCAVLVFFSEENSSEDLASTKSFFQTAQSSTCILDSD